MPESESWADAWALFRLLDGASTTQATLAGQDSCCVMLQLLCVLSIMSCWLSRAQLAQTVNLGGRLHVKHDLCILLPVLIWTPTAHAVMTPRILAMYHSVMRQLQ